MFNKNTKSFTIIETLVAIAFLLTAISAPLAIAARGIYASRVARDQVVATYLAQESIEMIRYIRDKNFMDAFSSNRIHWLRFIPKDSWFMPDWADAQNGTLKLCANSSDPTTCNYLKYSGAYNLSVGGTSKFKRAVIVRTDPNYPYEAEIESRVYFRSGYLPERMVMVKTRIYDWAKVE